MKKSNGICMQKTKLKLHKFYRSLIKQYRAVLLTDCPDYEHLFACCENEFAVLLNCKLEDKFHKSQHLITFPVNLDEVALYEKIFDLIYYIYKPKELNKLKSDILTLQYYLKNNGSIAIEIELQQENPLYGIELYELCEDLYDWQETKQNEDKIIIIMKRKKNAGN